MSVLILKNVDNEGPGTIAAFLDDEGIAYSIVEPEDISRATLGGFDSLVVMGGPMGVYEAHDYPHVTAAMALMREALDSRLPVLGICLGAQMLAEILGAKAYPGEKGQEVGWFDITLSADGSGDPAMKAYAGGSAAPLKVFHFHGDTFDIPAGAARLAGSELYENQAFRYGDNTYGLQFHIEVTAEMVADWMEHIPGGAGVSADSARYISGFDAAARRFYKVFFKVK